MLSIYIEIYSWKTFQNISLSNPPTLQMTHSCSGEVETRTLASQLSVQCVLLLFPLSHDTSCIIPTHSQSFMLTFSENFSRVILLAAVTWEWMYSWSYAKGFYKYINKFSSDLSPSKKLSSFHPRSFIKNKKTYVPDGWKTTCASRIVLETNLGHA